MWTSHFWAIHLIDCNSHYALRKGPWELLNYQPHLCAWKSHGAGPPRTFAEAQGGDLRQSAWLQPRVSPDWLTWRPSVTEWLHQWTKWEWQVSFIWTSVKPWSQSPASSFSLNSRVIDLMDGFFSAQGFSWMVWSREQWPTAQCPESCQWQVVSFRGPYGDQLCLIFINQIVREMECTLSNSMSKHPQQVCQQDQVTPSGHTWWKGCHPEAPGQT